MPAAITTADMLDELRRELALRQRVYPAWIAKGTLAKPKAERQLAVLKAAIARLDELMSYADIYAEARQRHVPRG